MQIYQIELFISVIFVLNFQHAAYMKIIKLNATTSTNDYLKQLSKETRVEDFTAVWAENQTAGRGQRGAVFLSEPFKSLTFSVYVNEVSSRVEDMFILNFLVSNVIVEALESFNLTNIYIKWPNDILSDGKKIAGILIENTIKSDGGFQSIIGIGINVQSINFNGIEHASSITEQNKVSIDREELLIKIVDLLSKRIPIIEMMRQEEKERYHSKLFKKDIVSTFETLDGNYFNAIINGVDHEGRLMLTDQSGNLRLYG